MINKVILLKINLYLRRQFCPVVKHTDFGDKADMDSSSFTNFKLCDFRGLLHFSKPLFAHL